MKLSEFCKAPENKFDYFLEKELCIYKYDFPGFSNLSTKFKQVTFEGKLCQLSERGCASPVKSYNSCRIKHEQQGFQNYLLHYKKVLTFFHRSRLL